VAVDLLSAGWPCYELPYLTSIHASAILSATHVAGVPQPLWDRIRDAGDGQRSRCSDRVSISPHYSITRGWRGTPATWVALRMALAWMLVRYGSS